MTLDQWLPLQSLLGAATYHMTEYCPLIGAQYPVRRGQFPPCGSGRETMSSRGSRSNQVIRDLATWVQCLYCTPLQSLPSVMTDLYFVC